MRFHVINRRHDFARDPIGCACLQSDDALTASRQKIFWRQYFGKKLLAFKFKLRWQESEPLEAGARQNIRVAIVATGACAVLFLSNKSSTTPRGKTAAIASALSISLGKSFALCTATSMRFSISARSS